MKKPKEDVPVDGVRAHQLHLVRSPQEQHLSSELRTRRDDLENQLTLLRETKPQLGEDAYYEQLRPILVELAQLYDLAADQ